MEMISLPPVYKKVSTSKDIVIRFNLYKKELRND